MTSDQIEEATILSRNWNAIAHLNTSLEHQLNANRMINDLGAGSNIIGFAQGEKLNHIIKMRLLALQEAKKVDRELLNHKIPQFETHFEEYYIQGLSLYVGAMKEWFRNIPRGKYRENMQTELLAQSSLSKWDDWYVENQRIINQSLEK